MDVVKYTDDVIVSLDGPPDIHNQIRNLPSAFQKLKAGVRALKEIDPKFRVTGRCVLQRLNYRYLHEIINTSKSIGLDQISFLTADVSTSAFNHNEPWTDSKVVQIALSPDDTKEFEAIVNDSFARFGELYKSRYIAENPTKMRALVQYYKAIVNEAAFPQRKCNAPWVSAVIEADGEVRPCFFHKSYGNLFGRSLPDVLNSPEAISFRKSLKVNRDPVCKRCVCSLHVGIRQLL
jgi:MoaA/NifB/PqqE/SkfB family radical SAM enzyme